MKARLYNPDERAVEKAASRKRDEDALAARLVSREELQRANGGNGLFRRSRILRKPRQDAQILPA